MLSTYEEFGCVRLERGDIYTAMLAHWFCHSWGWRDRLKGGEFGQDVKEPLCLRVASVLDGVGEAAVGVGIGRSLQRPPVFATAESTRPN